VLKRTRGVQTVWRSLRFFRRGWLGSPSSVRLPTGSLSFGDWNYRWSLRTAEADAFNVDSTPVAADMEVERGKEFALPNEDNERKEADDLGAERVPLDDRLVSNLDVTSEECLEDAVYAENEVVSSEEEKEGSLIIPRDNEVSPEPFNAIQDPVNAIEAQSSSPLRNSRITDNSNVQADALKRRAGVLVKWQSLFVVLLSSGTVRMTVDHY
jgi:hypothetical protein